MITIIDYGAGNLRSIQRAIEAGGGEVTITADPDQVRDAERVVLPGVGNARAAMERLNGMGMADAVTESVAEGMPLLGVCLGMQLLFGDQEEGPTTGLGLLAGDARKLPADHKIPHMGWNTVRFAAHTPLSDSPESPFYFVHSYIVNPASEADIAGVTDYGVPFPSIVIHDNVWGTQFHPEKSGDAGLRLIAEWLRWKP
ncbi:MAG TPA: imidazole glycerol phosphate synthase subunit HisH [Thermomicrobiales bacterium]|nr:imidazole glycerol phosphate synthase subunit HisH [Thermomicrobiales bacterium]